MDYPSEHVSVEVYVPSRAFKETINAGAVSMDKKTFSERDICTKFITPAIEQAGWNIKSQVREEFPLTDGRVIVRGRMHSRARPRRADYVLNYQKNQPIAVIEAKDNKHSLGDGILKRSLQRRSLTGSQRIERHGFRKMLRPIQSAKPCSRS